MYTTLSLTSALVAFWWSMPPPGRFIPGNEPVPILQEAGGPQGRSGRVRKISPQPGFDPRTVLPVASRYTHLQSSSSSYVMQLGHLSTRSGLMYPEVSSKVYHDSFCQLGISVSLPWVIYLSQFKNPYSSPLKMVLIGRPETSVRNYHCSLRNDPEERSSHLLRDGCLTSHKCQYGCSATHSVTLRATVYCCH